MVKNDFQVLPFYKSLDEQHHRKPYAFGNIYPLIFPTNYFPPFQLELTHIDMNKYYERLESAGLYSPEGKKLLDMKEMLYEGWDYLTTGGPTDYFVFSARPAGIDFKMKEGFAYLRLEFITGETFYSEVMCFSSRAEEGVVLEWSDNIDLKINETDSLFYVLNYTNMVFLDSAIGKPEYDLDEEGEERDGYFFAEKQISKKTYRFTFLAPEYLLDIMRLASLSDYISIDYKGKHYRCDSILLNADWEEQGDLASVEAEFTSGSVIKKIARAWPQ